MRVSSELRKLSVFFWVAGILTVGELALELRAYHNGYASLLFGSANIAISAPGPSGTAAFGPRVSFPFRSRIVPAEKTPDAVRIWISSSSYAEDERIPAGKIFPNLMEDLLRAQQQRNVQVLNASKAGESVSSNVADLSQGAARWRPDIVLLYQMANDINAISKQAGQPSHDKTPASSEGVAHSLWDATEEKKLVEETTTYEQANNVITAWVSAQGILADRFTDEQVAEFDRRIRAFVKAAQASGAVPVLSTFATSHTSKQWPNIPDSVRKHMFQFNRELSLAGWVNTVERLNGVIREVARDEAVLLIDLSAEIGGHPELFRDFYHFSLEGHRRVAAVLADGLRDRTALVIARAGRMR